MARCWSGMWTAGQSSAGWMDTRASFSRAAFSPDGQIIVTAGHDRTARIWPSVDALLAEAESLIERDPAEFTPEERVRFGLPAE
jgi:WD40 repeat protein